MKRVLLTVLFLLIAVDCSARLHNLGTVGTVYPIVEPDTLEEIKHALAQVDWSKVFSREKVESLVRSYHPDLTHLPRAKKDRVRLVDMTYTLPFDIRDAQGRVIYPKGYTFNPLDYIHYPRTLVVIDASDRAQVKWLKKSGFLKRLDVLILLTGGSWWKVEQELKRPVYYADTVIVNRFNLQAVPSIIKQKGRYMEVREVAVK